MNECANAEIRDLLPDLLHEQLDAALRADVETHVSGCASCRDELALLRSLRLAMRSNGVRVDVAAIVAALPAPSVAKVDPTVVSLASRRRRITDWRIAAAATLLIAGGASMAVLRERSGVGGSSVAVRTAETTPRTASPVSPEAVTSAVVAAVAPGATAGAAPAAPPHEIVRVADAASGELAVTAGLSDLSDDQLRSLIGSLDRIQAVPDAEPDQNPVRLPNDPGATP